jgi:ABC-type nitrate/sulfonate/bicarbonate transport system substrate-binding protein
MPKENKENDELIRLKRELEAKIKEYEELMEDPDRYEHPWRVLGPDDDVVEVNREQNASKETTAKFQEEIKKLQNTIIEAEALMKNKPEEAIELMEKALKGEYEEQNRSSFSP